jgi:hypothetical protein
LEEEMFLTKIRKDFCTVSMIFTLLITVFLWGANLTINAQTIRRVPFDFTGDGRTDWATIANLTAPDGTPLRWKILGNPASAAPNAAFKRDFDYGVRGDNVVPRDYTGDRKTEVAVWREGAPGIHYVSQFPTGTGASRLSEQSLGDKPMID